MMTAELSLTVPVVNTLAFLFTVVGEWWVEGKVISRGMFFLVELDCVGEVDADIPNNKIPCSGCCCQ